MQTVLEQGSIDKPLTFDVGLIQLSFIPVCSLNTCNISVKLCQGFALQCFSLLLLKTCYIQVTGDSRRDVLKSMIFCFCIGNTDFHQKLVDIVLLEHIVHINFRHHNPEHCPKFSSRKQFEQFEQQGTLKDVTLQMTGIAHNLF